MTSNMINWRKVEEEMRHNREMERLTGEQQAETVRHDKAVEYETSRSNRADEGIRRQQNTINAVHYTMSDVYGTVLPELRGKTTSTVTANLAKAGESKAKAQESSNRANLFAAEVLLTHAKTANVNADTINKLYSRDEIKASTTLKQQQAEKIGYEMGNIASQTKLNEQTYKFNRWNNPIKIITNAENAVQGLGETINTIKSGVDKVKYSVFLHKLNSIGY